MEPGVYVLTAGNADHPLVATLSLNGVEVGGTVELLAVDTDAGRAIIEVAGKNYGLDVADFPALFTAQEG